MKRYKQFIIEVNKRQTEKLNYQYKQLQDPKDPREQKIKDALRAIQLKKA